MPQSFLLCALAVTLCLSCPILCCCSWFFNPGPESYFDLYLCTFAREGGACMQVCVGVFTHAFCYTKAKFWVPTQ